MGFHTITGVIEFPPARQPSGAGTKRGITVTTGSKRRCTTCGQVLSRYNTNALCGPCAHQARSYGGSLEATAVPSEVWDRDDVREALARWDLGATSVRIRRYTGLRERYVNRLIMMVNR